MRRMVHVESKLLDLIEQETERGLHSVNAAEMGAAVDMLKDLSEAKYYCAVVEAMQNDSSGYEADSGDSFGYSSGTYSHRGETGPYNAPQRAYDRYQSARMGYQSHSTADNRRKMEQTADEHMREVEETMRDIWRDADQPQRTKMKSALVNLANELR